MTHLTGSKKYLVLAAEKVDQRAISLQGLTGIAGQTGTRSGLRSKLRGKCQVGSFVMCLVSERNHQKELMDERIKDGVKTNRRV